MGCLGVHNCVFGTVLILSYYKILATSLDLLTVGYARDMNGTVLGLWNSIKPRPVQIDLTSSTW